MKFFSWLDKDLFFDILYVAFSLFLLSVISWLPLPLAQMKLLVYIIDGYWVLVLIIAALRSSEFAPRGGVIPLPNRLIGLILFLSCFTYEVFAFGDMYYSICDDFKSSETQATLIKKSDANYLSLGTMTTIDIVDFSATSDAAKELKAFQIVSNFLMFFSIFPLLMARLSSFKDVPSQRLKKNGESDFKDWPFKATTIKEITGIAPEEWCDFSGLFYDTKTQIIEKRDFDFSGDFPTLKMNVTKDQLDIGMEFDLSNTGKTITITKYNLGDDNVTYNYLIFKEIVDLAKREKFSFIKLSVANTTLSPGLSRWEKFGFTPSTKTNNALWEMEFSLAKKSSNLERWKSFLAET